MTDTFFFSREDQEWVLRDSAQKNYECIQTLRSETNLQALQFLKFMREKENVLWCLKVRVCFNVFFFLSSLSDRRPTDRIPQWPGLVVPRRQSLQLRRLLVQLWNALPLSRRSTHVSASHTATVVFGETFKPLSLKPTATLIAASPGYSTASPFAQRSVDGWTCANVLCPLTWCAAKQFRAYIPDSFVSDRIGDETTTGCEWRLPRLKIVGSRVYCTLNAKHFGVKPCLSHFIHHKKRRVSHRTMQYTSRYQSPRSQKHDSTHPCRAATTQPSIQTSFVSSCSKSGSYQTRIQSSMSSTDTTHHTLSRYEYYRSLSFSIWLWDQWDNSELSLTRRSAIIVQTSISSQFSTLSSCALNASRSIVSSLAAALVLREIYKISVLILLVSSP